jgi:hypothetical protein
MSDDMARRQETFNLFVKFPNHEEVVQTSLGSSLEKMNIESDTVMNVGRE